MATTEHRRHFLDSNVLLHVLSGDDARIAAVQALLRTRPLLSVQVLNEVTHVCRRTLRMDWGEIDEFLSILRFFCKVAPLTVEVHDRARSLAARYQLAFYDACIAGAALLSGCDVLYSEDMNPGLVLEEKLRIVNPFLHQTAT